MPRTWRGLPLTTDPKIIARAPTYEDYLEQVHDTEHRGGFYLPRIPHMEHPVAAALLESIRDVREMAIGPKWELWRYPTGLAVKAPSGWTFMTPLQVPKKGKGATEGTTASGEPSPAEPVRAKRGGATS